MRIMTFSNYLTTKQYICLMLTFLLIHHLYTILYSYGYQLDLELVIINGTQPKPLGLIAKNYFFQYLPLTIIYFIVMSRWIPPKIKINTEKANRLCFYGFSAFMVSLMIYGLCTNPFSRTFNFFGYTHEILNIMLYLTIPMLIFYYQRQESVLENVLLAILGIITVSYLWEFPFVLQQSLLSGNHIYYYVISRIRDFLPVVAWFLLTRATYKHFLTSHKLQVILLSILIATLTYYIMCCMSHYNFFISFALRLVYAILLVFYPFRASRT